MKIEATTVDEYLKKVPAERQSPARLRALLRSNLPEGFEEVLSYGTPAMRCPMPCIPKGTIATPIYHCPL